MINPLFIQELINQEINSIDYNRKPERLYEPINYFMGLGGKRMRPVLSILSCYLFNNDFEKAVKPSLALELFHNFTLIHDDIMDNAPLRRGMPTVHEKWNVNVAILSGDVTLIKAYEMLEYIAPDIRLEIFKLFNHTAKEVCEGQQFDMDFEQRSDVSIDEYIKMISLKTAVLLGLSMYMGARIGGASTDEAQLMYDIAKNMGISFQIKDDYLDVFGEAEKVGKFVGGDIVSGKKTFLLIKAYELADANQKNELNRLLNDQNIEKVSKVNAVLNIYNQLNIKDISYGATISYFDKAIFSLNQLNVDHSKKQFVIQYFKDLLGREK
ncbi:MAG: polyprenyl synthetase family protein [Bacteroidota bacterium]|nr:polyprenyl synthetase family protein [Bacteroidota bacterium]